MSQTNSFAGVVVLIPAYNPDNKLIDVIEDLVGRQCENIVVVNDGSTQDYDAVFDAVEKYDAVTLCTHASNQGKGAALKTGLQLVLDSSSPPDGVVTADADGQHLGSDIQKLADAALHQPTEVVLGCRTFGKEMPFRSWLGNRVTAYFMAFAHGISLPDTQTGLRYIPLRLIPELLSLSGNRYDFELQCLIRANDSGYELHHIPISSVYIDDNASSHFSPIADSIRIYNVLLRFSGSSIVSFGVDITLFALVFWSSGNVMLATIVARSLSGIVNFSINRFFVFRRRHNRDAKREALRYLLLWLAVMLTSGNIVSVAAESAAVFVVFVKILVDISLFLLSYYIQSRFVFTDKR